jgi:hypothetical protein
MRRRRPELPGRARGPAETVLGQRGCGGGAASLQPGLRHRGTWCGHSDTSLLQSLLTDLTVELRARREPEYLYTAAALGSFGAVAWGVAALSSTKTLGGRPWWIHPAVVASVGTIPVAAAVITKIIIEHSHYKGLREELARISGYIADALAKQPNVLPTGLVSPEPRKGYLWSICVVGVSALAAAEVEVLSPG